MLKGPVTARTRMVAHESPPGITAIIERPASPRSVVERSAHTGALAERQSHRASLNHPPRFRRQSNVSLR
jgi:hypothetical protein